VKTLIMTLAAATALSAGAAAAQPYGHAYGHGRWMSIDARQDQLERRIDRGVARGDLTRREAYQARMEFRRIARLEARYRVNGLTNWERADLDRRFDQLAMQIRWDRRDGDRRYGYNDYNPPY
jgi:Ni/Co efflux regulator RcnB